MIDRVGALVDPRGLLCGDVDRLQVVAETQGEIDVRPRVLAIIRCRTDDCRSSDPVVAPRDRDETIAESLPFGNAEHAGIVWGGPWRNCSVCAA